MAASEAVHAKSSAFPGNKARAAYCAARTTEAVIGVIRNLQVLHRVLGCRSPGRALPNLRPSRRELTANHSSDNSCNAHAPSRHCSCGSSGTPRARRCRRSCCDPQRTCAAGCASACQATHVSVTQCAAAGRACCERLRPTRACADASMRIMLGSDCASSKLRPISIESAPARASNLAGKPAAAAAHLASTSRPARCPQTRHGSTRSCTAARAGPPTAGPAHARRLVCERGGVPGADVPCCRAQPRKA